MSESSVYSTYCTRKVQYTHTVCSGQAQAQAQDKKKKSERLQYCTAQRSTVRDVGERAGVHEDWGALERLHQVRLQGVLHEHRERARHAEVVARDRHACDVRAQVH